MLMHAGILVLHGWYVRTYLAERHVVRCLAVGLIFLAMYSTNHFDHDHVDDRPGYTYIPHIYTIYCRPSLLFSL